MRLSFLSMLALRAVLCTLLVCGTWNPTGYSWAHYAANTWRHPNGLFAVSVVVLIIAWVVLGGATWKALGVIGWVLTALLLGALAWAAKDAGLLDVSRNVGAWVVLFGIIVVHTVGLSWRDLRRKVNPGADLTPR